MVGRNDWNTETQALAACLSVLLELDREAREVRAAAPVPPPSPAADPGPGRAEAPR